MLRYGSLININPSEPSYNEKIFPSFLTICRLSRGGNSSKWCCVGGCSPAIGGTFGAFGVVECANEGMERRFKRLISCSVADRANPGWRKRDCCCAICAMCAICAKCWLCIWRWLSKLGSLRSIMLFWRIGGFPDGTNLQIQKKNLLQYFCLQIILQG